jgi:hypothetical protein
VVFYPIKLSAFLNQKFFYLLNSKLVHERHGL